MHRNVLQHAGVDGALHLFEVDLGHFQQAQAARTLGLQLVAVVVRSQRRGWAEPFQALQRDVQPLREVHNGRQIGQGALLQAKGTRPHAGWAQYQSADAGQGAVGKGLVEWTVRLRRLVVQVLALRVFVFGVWRAGVCSKAPW